jgi:hypothetical protein
MKLMTSCAAFALTLALGAPALAQQTQATSPAGHDMSSMPSSAMQPPAAGAMGGAATATGAKPAPSTSTDTSMQPPAGAAAATGATASQPGASAATAAGADASVTTGMTVKDNTGTAIGSISEVKADASGAKVATIKMGTEVFAVDTSSLAVKDGSALINASQAEIKDMMKKK